MQLYLENETEVSFEFDVEAVAGAVIKEVLNVEKCPYDVEVNLLLTDNEGIREYNRQMRNIDRNNENVNHTVNVKGCTFNNIPDTSHKVYLLYAYNGWTLNTDLTASDVYWKAN